MLKTCPICGEEFEPNHGNQKYCSKECLRIKQKEWDRHYYQEHKKEKREYDQKYYQEHKKELKPKKCEFCGKEFIPYRKNQRYCSDKCSRRHYHQKHKEKAKEYYREYSRKYYREHKEKIREYNQRYYKKRKKTLSKVCEVCGKEFKLNHGLQKYCSKECARIKQNEQIQQYRQTLEKDIPDPRCIKLGLSCFECPYEDCRY